MRASRRPGTVMFQRDRLANRLSTTDWIRHRPTRFSPARSLVRPAGAALDRESGLAHSTVHSRRTPLSLAATTRGGAGRPRSVAEETGPLASPTSRSDLNAAG